MYVSHTGKMISLLCRHSSVVEHVIGNDGVVSPILTGGTTKQASPKGGFFSGCF